MKDEIDIVVTTFLAAAAVKVGIDNHDQHHNHGS